MARSTLISKFLIASFILSIFVALITGKIVLQKETAEIKNLSSQCEVCGPQGIHNIEGKKCAPGLECKPGETTSASYCLKPGSSIRDCKKVSEDGIANWKTYASEKYKFSIKYPGGAKFMPGETIYTPLDFYVYIQGNEYPLGTSVAVGILGNPKKLSLKELGNQTYATDSPEPYDLGWKEVKFQRVEALTTKYGPPGDSGLMTIYLFERKGVIYSVWKSPIDEPNSKYFDNLSDQILSTFRFLE